MTASPKSPTTAAEFHEAVLNEATPRLAQLRRERRSILRAKIAYASSFLLLLVGSLALGDVTVAQALTTISTSTPLV